MEDNGLLARRAISNPLRAATIATAMGAVFGFALHLFTVSWSKYADATPFVLGSPSSPASRTVAVVGHENPTPFVLGFALTGTVVGLTASYWSYISRRVQKRVAAPFRDGGAGIDFVHGALAGILFFGGGSLVLTFTGLPFMNGEPRGTEWFVFLTKGLFSLGGVLLLDRVGIEQATVSEMIHSENPTQFLLGVLCVPIASAAVGAFVGVLATTLLTTRY